MKKALSTIFSIIAAAFLGFFLFKNSPLNLGKTHNREKIIAITQIAPHPSLDRIRAGIIHVLENSDFKNYKIVYENAQGNISLATQIAQKFLALNPSLVIPITTPSAQVTYNILSESQIPIVFCAVSDPVSAKLTQEKTKNLTGVSDSPPIEKQIALIKRIVPHLKNLGVIYNPGEENSVKIVTLLSEMAKRADINLVKAAVNRSADISVATQYLLGQIDALYVGNDNTVVMGMDKIIQIMSHHKTPIFPSDPESVKKGATATLAHDQYAIGLQTGEMAIRILKGTSPGQIPIEYAQKVDYIINETNAQKIGLKNTPKTFP